MIKLARLFQEGCVLQQKKPCIIWGKGEPRRSIKVNMQGISAEGIADEEGNWEVTLSPLTASAEETLTVTDGEETLTVEHIAVGEVWILGGQSNMEFFMRYDSNLKEELKELEELEEQKNKNFPDIRFFDYPELSYMEAEEDFDYSRFGFWRKVNKENLEYFSAVGYHFARQIAPSIDVPIGLVGCNWGGTPACAWMSHETLLKHGKVWLDDYEKQIKANGLDDPEKEALYKKAWRSTPLSDHGNPFADVVGERLLYGMNWEEQQEIIKNNQNTPQTVEANPMSVMGPYHPYRPNGLYETMLKQIAPFTARGVLWYQGESDSAYPEFYTEVLSAMIGDWRALWRDQLPFFLVQIAPFYRWLECDGIRYPEVRKAQEEVADQVPDVYLASIGDVGMKYDIHPKQKKPVGSRLGLLAQKYVYKKDVQADAPRFFECLTDKAGFVIQFLHTGEGLYANGDVRQEFELFDMDEGRKLEDAEYRMILDDSKIRVEFLNEKKTVSGIRVAYCIKDYYVANIYNSKGLPLFPFEMEIVF